MCVCHTHSKHFLNNTLLYVPVYTGKFVQNLFLLYCSTINNMFTSPSDWFDGQTEWPADCATDCLADWPVLNSLASTSPRWSLAGLCWSGELFPHSTRPHSQWSQSTCHTQTNQSMSLQVLIVSHIIREQGVRWCLINTKTKQSMSFHCRFWVCPTLIIIIFYIVPQQQLYELLQS